MSSPDKILVDRVKNGDREAFTTLMERYQQKVFQTSIGFLHNQADAEDLTQEVFIKAYKSLKSFRGESSFGTWIYRIAVNRAINQLRKDKLRALTGPDASEAEHPVADTNADEPLLRKEQKEQIKRALNKLNNAQKKAFILFYYQELSMKEVAEVLKLSPKAAESLLFRARKSLQKELGRN